VTASSHPALSTSRYIQTRPTFDRTFALQACEVLFCSIGAPFAGLDLERATTPRDESEAEVQRSTVEQVHSTP
jgi:hypothetical protein